MSSGYFDLSPLSYAFSLVFSRFLSVFHFPFRNFSFFIFVKNEQNERGMISYHHAFRPFQ